MPAAGRRRRPGRCLFEEPLSELLERTFDVRPRARRRADRRDDRHVRARRRPAAAPEPLLPLPRDRQRHRQLGRARRRHGRADAMRSRRPRGDAGARAAGPDAEVDVDRRPTASSAEVALRRRRARSPRPTCSPTSPRPCSPSCSDAHATRDAARGLAAEDQHAAARGCRGCATPHVAPGRRVRRHVPRQRGLRAAADARTSRRAPGGSRRVPPCELYCHSLTDPSILAPELREAGAHTLTLFGAAHAARGSSRGADAERAPRHARSTATLRSVELGPRRAARGLPVARADGTAVPRGPDAARARGRARRCPAGTSSTATCRWPFAEADDEVGRWGVETEHAERLAVRRRRAPRRRRQRDPRAQRGAGRARRALATLDVLRPSCGRFTSSLSAAGAGSPREAILSSRRRTMTTASRQD